MSEIVAFDFETLPVRMAERQGEPWFVLADVCRVLGIANSRDAAARLDDDEKGVVTTDTLGGPQDMTLVNESGLYSLTFTSRKPVAKRFKKWVTADVLPTIRKTGGYGAATGGDLRVPVQAARVMRQLKLETNPALRRTHYAFLVRLCASWGVEAPPLEEIGRDAPPLPDVAAPFFAGLDRLTELGVRWNHARRPDRIAVNLKEVAAHFAAHGIPVVIDTPLRTALKACQDPPFLGRLTVNSGLTGRSVRCWVFGVGRIAL
ncbi:BRO-N domain-containing protein [Roseospira visakhapatnamensis]|uniref:Prophage antirepressor-like protein n=1 Tax=Roseospira visakhapatnamensis TaxID=390880 RepID=A0A7W6RFX7_9PROT|nr:Bro-N domain-containing protein [Roseospira visakhapatnamensis]MBB4267834.1 prophage antirepressor-like protein [Roseospira visakhapatnamensis]